VRELGLCQLTNASDLLMLTAQQYQLHLGDRYAFGRPRVPQPAAASTAASAGGGMAAEAAPQKRGRPKLTGTLKSVGHGMAAMSMGRNLRALGSGLLRIGTGRQRRAAPAAAQGLADGVHGERRVGSAAARLGDESLGDIYSDADSYRSPTPPLPDDDLAHD